MDNLALAFPGSLDLSGWFTEEEAEVYRSLVYPIRCGVVVEVGVWKGRSISSIVNLCRANKNRLYAVDSWRSDLSDPGYVEATDKDIGAVFRENLRCLGHDTTVDIIPEGSLQAASRFPDCYVDLVFLDADHSYDAVKSDIQAWSAKVTRRGVICGHDYTTRPGVRRAVDEAFQDCVALPGGSIWAVKKNAVLSRLLTGPLA